jgi:E3 ubiquitin-protein ligase BIG BROTHER-like protein
MQDRYFSGIIPAEIAENLQEFTEQDDDDLSYEEFVMQQEGVYESIKANGWSRGTITRTTNNNNNHISNHGNSNGESSTAISQLGSDEALARALQELEHDEFDISAGSSEISPTETPARANHEEDDVDPDNMSYEELQSLGDTIGVESSGLSDERISRLPSFKYYNRAGLFSKKKKTEVEECVICCMTFDNGERLTKLPCKHKYHPKCITRWLKLKKRCPVCQEEVL